ncbi:BTAD domain-containing putative transcriptional regulator [Fodinicola acaciae]|uniref:BTAD domain-containing putative transcriptional regulator n=1 Tax=Fodinicola acaciae TaxID=2681555 RepID=UPI0013D5BAF1|nr:BTAD domain-containing putative transcriptional regulator [Fodinicola acaciae]
MLDATTTGQDAERRTGKAVRLCVLGPVRAWHLADGIEVEVALGGPKQRAVLAVLALAGGRSVSRDAIIDFVWGDAPPPRVSATVQTYVANLRQALEPGRTTSKKTRTQSRLLLSRGGGYQLSADQVAIDLLRFRELVTAAYGARQAGDLRQAAAMLTEAIGLRTGPFLDDLGGALRLHPSVAAIEQEYLGTAVDCADVQLQAGAADDVLGWLPALAAAEPLSESLQMRLMTTYAVTGQPGRAMEIFERTRRQLAEEFGIGPSRELREAHLALLQADEELANQRETVDLTELMPIRRWLGRPPDQRALVGRDGALPELVQLVRNNRVVTLVGPGGAGKTALGLATAQQMLDSDLGVVADGVVVVECGRLPAEPDRADEGSGLVAEALRSTIQARPNGRESAIGAVVRTLQGQRRLIVLDNAEHVRASCNRLADQLVRACPSLRIVVTSRRQLGWPLETVYEVPPLELPPEGETRGAVLLASPAVQLFVDLAHRVRRGIDTDSQLPVIARICRHVEGLPLAIELATARLRAMSIADLAERLENSASVIAAASDHRLPHQRALKATYEWSAQLLPPAERRLLARLAVFPTAFDLPAAEQVCGHDGIDPLDIPTLLANLVDNSMIQAVDEGGHVRYRLLIPIREFAADGTDESDLDATRRRHLDWCFGQMTNIGEVNDPHRAAQIAVVRAHIDDLYSALEWALESTDEHMTTNAAELLAAARPVFDFDFGNLQTARDFTQRTLQRWDVLSAASHGRLRHWAGRLAYLQGRPLEARSHLETALRLLTGKSEDDFRRRSDICVGIASCRFLTADRQCLGIIEESLKHAEATGDKVLFARRLTNAGSMFTHWGRLDRALALLERAAAMADSHPNVGYLNSYRLANFHLMNGDPRRSLLESAPLVSDPGALPPSVVIEAYAYRGWAQARLGDYDSARADLRRSLELGHDRPIDRTYIHLATADLERLAGNVPHAVKHLRKSMLTSLAFGDLRTAILAVFVGAELSLTIDPRRADTLAGFALACREVTGLPAWPLTEEHFAVFEKSAGATAASAPAAGERAEIVSQIAESCQAVLAEWSRWWPTSGSH